MHKSVFFNGEILDAFDADILAVSSAVLYSKGIFTTVAIYDGEVFLWEKHWQRLVHNAAKIGIDLSEHSEETTRNALDELIAKNCVMNGRARITFYDETPSEIWQSDISSGRKTSLSIITGELRQIPKPFKLTISPYPVNSRSLLAGVKSCNYLENLMAYDEAKKRGFDEAIRLNERGHVTSACIANIFWLKDGHLYTPNLASGCLAGTTREFVIENLGCDEVEAGIDAIHSADAVFLTSAGLGITAIHEFDGRKLDPIPQQIKDVEPRKNTKPRE